MHLSPNRHRHILVAWILVLLGILLPKEASVGRVPSWWRPITASGSSYTSVSYLPAVSGGVPIPAVSNEESAFILSVANGPASEIQGVYSDGLFSLRVVQQPNGNLDFVNMTPGTATQFKAAGDHGITGLLADNAASGAEYYRLQIGVLVDVIYGDGSIKRYKVARIEKYQALDPYNPYSGFVDLKDGASLSAGQLFNRVYTGSDHLTLQTCLANQGVPAWGRTFVIALPQN